MLELLKVLARKGKHIMSSLIKVWIDNKYVNQKVCRELMKPSLFLQDAGAKITQIREILEITNFTISINIILGYPKVRALFAEDPKPHLIIQCNREARKVWEQIYTYTNQSNIKFSSIFTIKKDGAIINILVKEIIWVNDTKDVEYE